MSRAQLAFAPKCERKVKNDEEDERGENRRRHDDVEGERRVFVAGARRPALHSDGGGGGGDGGARNLQRRLSPSCVATIEHLVVGLQEAKMRVVERKAKNNESARGKNCGCALEAPISKNNERRRPNYESTRRNGDRR